MHVIRLLLVVMMLLIVTDVHAARMSDYADNTTPNADVYFIGVDPNDTSQTVRGSNYRYSLASILSNGLLDATFKSLTVSGTGDSWLELENNTSFTDSLAGKYGIRFYNGVLQQILNGIATNIGSASIQELASDPTYTDLDTGEMAVSTASGDLFIKTATGLYTIAGTYTADHTTPTLTSLTIPTSGDTATAVFSEAVSYGAGGAGGWTLNSPTNAMTYASGAGTDTIVFNLASTILSTDTPTVSYTQPTNGFESADDGVDLASIPNASVTNNSTQTGSVTNGLIGRITTGAVTHSYSTANQYVDTTTPTIAGTVSYAHIKLTAGASNEQMCLSIKANDNTNLASGITNVGSGAVWLTATLDTPVVLEEGVSYKLCRNSVASITPVQAQMGGVTYYMTGGTCDGTYTQTAAYDVSIASIVFDNNAGDPD